VQEELDLRELFVLTSSHARDVPVDDDADLIDVLSEEQRGLTYDEVKAEVTKNLTANLHTMCVEVRDALRATDGSGYGSRDDVTAEYRRRAGFSARVEESTVPNAGRGLFVDGQVDPGEIVCVYPGVVYAPENLRHMPGYPKIAADNPYLVARYDGSVVDASPWGLGAGWSKAGRSKTSKNKTVVNERQRVEGFGRWPGAPIGTDGRTAGGGHTRVSGWSTCRRRRLAPRRGWRDSPGSDPARTRQGRGRRGGQAAPARARAPRQPPAERHVAQRRGGIRGRRL